MTLMARAARHRDCRRPLGQFDQLRKQERARLDAMSDAIKLTMTAFILVALRAHGAHGVAHARDGARGHRERDGELEGQANGQISTTRATVEQVARGDLPRRRERSCCATTCRTRRSGCGCSPGEESYSGQALVATPFGIEAVFALAIPPAHEWGKMRRVAELSAGTEVHVPKESGWLSKRVAVAPVKLDKLVVTEVAWRRTARSSRCARRRAGRRAISSR